MATITMLALVEMSLLAILTVVLLWWYRSPELTPPLITIIIGMAWFLGFSGTLLLPLDIAQGIYYGPSESILLVWKVVYWSTFLMAWLFLPVLYEAWYAGDYTWKDRIISALKVNIKSYVLTAVLGIVFGIYLMLSEDLSVWAITDFFMVFGNTYGFLLVIVLLGNGLVEVPRFLWRYGDTEREIKYIQMSAVSVDTELFDSQCELDDALRDVKGLDARVKAKVSVCASPVPIRRNNSGSGSEEEEKRNEEEKSHMLRLHMDLILDVCDFGMKANSVSANETAEYKSRHANRQASSGGNGSGGSPSSKLAPPRDEGGGGVPTTLMLSNTLKRVKLAQERLHASKQKWNNLLKQYEKFSMLLNSNNTGREGGTSGVVIENAVNQSSSSAQNVVNKLINLIRDIRYRNDGFAKLFLKGLSVACVVMSGIILWSEMFIGFFVSMSPWGWLIGGVAASGPHPIAIQIIALLPYAYMSLCTFYSLFKLKLFGLLTLCGPQQSTPGPLIFNAIYLIRLQFPLGLNYLLMLSPPNAHGNADIGANVAFKELFSSIDTIPLFGQGFVVYAPIVLALLCVFTIFNVYARILQFVGIDSDDIIDSEESQILLREGIMLLEQANRKNRKGGGQSAAGVTTSTVELSQISRQGREPVISPMFREPHV